MRAQGVRKGYGDNLLMDDLNFDLPKGGIVGVIGPNGAGKTTLFRMIVGQEQPDAGKLTVGPTVKIAYVDQNRDALAADNTIFEEITGGTDYLVLGKRKVASRGYVARFNFKGPDQQKRVGDCSGGERNRIHLAKLLRSGGNLLLLDEPTNDLDVDTLRALEDALVALSHRKPAGEVQVTTSRQGTKATIHVNAKGSGDLVLAVFDNSAPTPVRAGENGGRTIPNDATVRKLVRAGTLTGGVLDRMITLDVDPSWHQPGVAVFLQDGETLEIGAAASAAL